MDTMNFPRNPDRTLAILSLMAEGDPLLSAQLEAATWKAAAIEMAMQRNEQKEEVDEPESPDVAG